MEVMGCKALTVALLGETKIDFGLAGHVSLYCSYTVDVTIHGVRLVVVHVWEHLFCTVILFECANLCDGLALQTGITTCFNLP